MHARSILICLVVAAPALAESDDCRAVKRVIALAASSNLDTGELSRLEVQHCGRPSRAACQQLEEFWMLSLALQQPESTTTALEAQRGVWCGRETDPVRPLQWPDGQTLRSTSGTLSWPNGIIARSSSGSWSAPTGTLVRSSSGSLSYPNGSLARSSSGRWMLSSGEQAEEGRIASLACTNDVTWCRFFLGEINRTGGLSREFAQLGLGLLASR
ncbi:MAG: hypothetical protein Q8N23_29945 [Archangium sp.]|nr:hypothetical protein [Archangium sp.]MDP3575611.1 hypothetical protein [Archangium sp.]